MSDECPCCRAVSTIGWLERALADAREDAAEIAALREAVRCASGALPPEKYPYWNGLPSVVRALRGKKWAVCGSELP